MSKNSQLGTRIATFQTQPANIPGEEFWTVQGRLCLMTTIGELICILGILVYREVMIAR